MRYEEWTLSEPCERLERVLAYKGPAYVKCECCKRPAIWKLPRGRHGCGAFIMRTVGRQVSGHEWAPMSSWLSRSQTSPFEHLLAHDFVSTAVFETIFVDVHCLSCSCGSCSLKNVRAGVLCCFDRSWVEHEHDGPDSPRAFFQDLGDSHCDDLNYRFL